jgi:hypothetical protein
MVNIQNKNQKSRKSYRQIAAISFFDGLERKDNYDLRFWIYDYL